MDQHMLISNISLCTSTYFKLFVIVNKIQIMEINFH